MRIAPEGWPFAVPFVLAAALLGWLGYPWPMLGVLLAGFLVLLFFRDPARTFEGDGGLVLAAADGKVIVVDEVEDSLMGPGKLRRIGTFLSVFDVHVQRSPVEGEVVESVGRPGRKIAAFAANAAVVNESHLTVLRQADGSLVGVRQIAGLLARRVVAYLEPGDRVPRSGHLGIIKFGSRVDLLLPESYEPLVAPGQRVWAGETPVARRPGTSGQSP